MRFASPLGMAIGIVYRAALEQDQCIGPTKYSRNNYSLGEMIRLEKLKALHPNHTISVCQIRGKARSGERLIPHTQTEPKHIQTSRISSKHPQLLVLNRAQIRVLQVIILLFELRIIDFLRDVKSRWRGDSETSIATLRRHDM